MFLESGHLTLSGWQFYWGGSLLKSNGGVQRFSITIIIVLTVISKAKLNLLIDILIKSIKKFACYSDPINFY